MMQITLPEDSNNQFNLSLLIKYLIKVQRPYIVTGQQHVTLDNHTKKLSLDYWLRKNIVKNQDTAQATKDVIEQICATGLFKKSSNINCHDKNHECNGIELV